MSEAQNQTARTIETGTDIIEAVSAGTEGFCQEVSEVVADAMDSSIDPTIAGSDFLRMYSSVSIHREQNGGKLPEGFDPHTVAAVNAIDALKAVRVGYMMLNPELRAIFHGDPREAEKTHVIYATPLQVVYEIVRQRQEAQSPASSTH